MSNTFFVARYASLDSKEFRIIKQNFFTLDDALSWASSHVEWTNKNKEIFKVLDTQSLKPIAIITREPHIQLI